VSTICSGVRILSADLQQLHTVVPYRQDAGPCCCAQLPDGRVLVGNNNATITVLEGFPSAKWARRRTVLLCLKLKLQQAPGVLQGLAALPDQLWASVFQYM
jgi:hypothetical protein